MVHKCNCGDFGFNIYDSTTINVKMDGGLFGGMRTSDIIAGGIFGLLNRGVSGFMAGWAMKNIGTTNYAPTGGSIFGFGGGGYYGGGSGFAIDNTYSTMGAIPASGAGAPKKNADGTLTYTLPNGTTFTVNPDGTPVKPAATTDPAANPAATTTVNPAATTTVTEGNGVDGKPLTDDQKTAAKKAGNILLNAVNDKKADGTTEQIYSGVFQHTTKTNIENGATLKKDNDVRKQWHKGTASEATEADYKKAVVLGDADGKHTDTDPTTGAPQYFTMTDYRSGNQYTFHIRGYNASSGKLEYTVDTGLSKLSNDDNAGKGTNGKNWEFAAGAKDLIFSVNVNTTTNEIELTYSNGDKVALDKLAKKT